MRRGGASIAFALTLAAAAPAAADRAAGKRAPRHEVDVAQAVDKMILLSDGRGHYIALVPRGDTNLTFYGDGKTLHQLRILGASRDDGTGRESRAFWAPTSTPRGGDIDFADGRWTIRCSDRITPLIVASEAETGRILARAVFKKPLWQRQASALGRDDTGVYYYIDKLRDDLRDVRDPNPPTGYRLFIGRRGRLKLQRLTDSSHDSKGVVMSTRAGHVTVDHSTRRMVFTTRRGKEELVFLPVEDNVTMIYRDLGLYGRLGVPCDDM